MSPDMVDARRTPAQAITLAREHLTQNVELVPCGTPDAYVVHDSSEYLFYRAHDRAGGRQLGANRYLAVHMPTGVVEELEARE